MSSDNMSYNESLVVKELLKNTEKLAEDIMANIRILGLDINCQIKSRKMYKEGLCFSLKICMPESNRTSSCFNHR